ncbi:cytosolic 5'-nucleotidase 1A-like [Cyprinodon tularosa]|uniref:cytosolic 5'-nucleotidase 1A-like n=1 Tax=Cyprinodon tularosa TaxID=77115 RepID=UPI0018E1DA5F|nr:cytosolic 5'-nucleotidase 1A-like [Cyprinodon tularosa]
MSKINPEEQAKLEDRANDNLKANAVTIAVSSRTLFNMVEEGEIYDKGLEGYVKFQMEHENEPLKPGPAFPFVKV